MNWSHYQLDIFEAIAKQRRSYIVNAVAGSGKTTTIVEAIAHVPGNQSVAFLAFNKGIAEELKRRIKAPNAKCMTLHSAGLAAWRSHLQFDADLLEVDGKKTRKMMDALELSWAEVKKFGPQMGRLIAIAKGCGIVPQASVSGLYRGLVPDERDVWEELIDLYGLDEDEIDLDLTRAVLSKSIDESKNVIDYDDMLYMPIIAGSKFEKFDVVFLDEAQDVNGIQVEMVARMQRAAVTCSCPPLYAKEDRYLGTLCPVHGDMMYRKQSSRVIAVGDPHQAIYGFRGALSNSMDIIAERFDCEELPLSVSYRCPRAVVKAAQAYVPHIESSEDAMEGLVESPSEWRPGQFANSDAILCRVTRPLVETAFLLIRAKVGCRVLGRDIGQGLVKLVQKMKARNMDELWERLGEYRQREIEKMHRRGKVDENKVALLDDKIETINVFIDSLEKTDPIEKLIRGIEGLFGEASDGTRLLTLSTIHKAKGLEWDRVFILDAQEHMPSKWAKQPWQRIQEDNLHYVAITRARVELRYLTTTALRVGVERMDRAEAGAEVASGQ